MANPPGRRIQIVTVGNLFPALRGTIKIVLVPRIGGRQLKFMTVNLMLHTQFRAKGTGPSVANVIGFRVSE